MNGPPVGHIYVNTILNTTGVSKVATVEAEATVTVDLTTTMEVEVVVPFLSGLSCSLWSSWSLHFSSYACLSATQTNSEEGSVLNWCLTVSI